MSRFPGYGAGHPHGGRFPNDYDDTPNDYDDDGFEDFEGFSDSSTLVPSTEDDDDSMMGGGGRHHPGGHGHNQHGPPPGMEREGQVHIQMFQEVLARALQCRYPPGTWHCIVAVIIGSRLFNCGYSDHREGGQCDSEFRAWLVGIARDFGYHGRGDPWDVYCFLQPYSRHIRQSVQQDMRGGGRGHHGGHGGHGGGRF